MERLLSLVCGLPRRRWGQHLMGMFAVYLDDSGSHTTSDHYVLSGNVATVESWLAFTEAWDTALRSFGLTWLHMKDAESFRGEFKGWGYIERNLVVRRFAEIVAEHRHCGFTAYIDYRTYRQLANPLFRRYPVARRLGDAYHSAYSLALHGIADLCKHYGIDHRSMDIFMAKQKGFEGHTHRAWHGERRALELRAPIFREPRELLPLQGADMFAWRERRSYHKPKEKVPHRHRPLLERPLVRKELGSD